MNVPKYFDYQKYFVFAWKIISIPNYKEKKIHESLIH